MNLRCWGYYIWRWPRSSEYCIVQIVPNYCHNELPTSQQEAFLNDPKQWAIYRVIISKEPTKCATPLKVGEYQMLGIYAIDPRAGGCWNPILKKDIELTVLSLFD